MMLCGCAQNPQVTRKVALPMRRHYAAQRLPHPYYCDAVSHCERSIEPFILDESLDTVLGIDVDIRTETAWIDLRVIANQRSHVPQRAAREDMNKGRVEKGAVPKRKRIRQRSSRELGLNFFHRNIREDRPRIDLGARVLLGAHPLQRDLASKYVRENRRGVRV